MYIHLSNLRVKDLGYIIPKRPTNKRPRDVWMELATDDLFFKIRMATWWSTTLLPTPPFCGEREMMKWGVTGYRQGGEQWSSNQRAPSVHPSGLEAKLKLWEQRPGRRVVCLLRYEDPWTNQQHEVSETSPQGKNTATKLVTNTAI